MFAWNPSFEVDDCLGWYTGDETVYRTPASADRACKGVQKRSAYAMRLDKGGKFLVVDAAHVPDAFLRYVNDPRGTPVEHENAHFEVPAGKCTAHMHIPAFVLDKTDAENACAEIWCDYAQHAWRHSNRSNTD